MNTGCALLLWKQCDTASPRRTRVKVESLKSKANLFEVSVLALLPVHHVVEDWDHDVSDLRLRHQRDAQEWADHPGDEMSFVFAWGTLEELL